MKIKLILLGFYDLYCSVMDDSRNPLRHIPDPTSRMIIMSILAWLWCLTFGLLLGSIVYSGLSFVAHLALIFMVFLTAAIFYDAEKRNDEWLSNLRLMQKAH